MGYTPRYHAASLVAVFAALLVGIVIGAGLGSDVVSDTRTSLEESLEGDLDEARAEADELAREVGLIQSFADRAYPLVVENKLRGRRIAIIGLGSASVTTTRAIEEAVSPAGANLVAVAILNEDPARAELSGALNGKSNALDGLGGILGKSIARSGGRAENALDEAFTRATGQLSRIDGVVLVRNEPEPAAEDSAAVGGFEGALVAGLAQGGATVVGTERFDQADSAIGWFAEIGASTVDNIDETAGKTSLVFALRGVRGNFGRKPSADRLIPDLLTVASQAGS